MKKKISLGGYKAIGEIANFNLAPITLLIGPNGSGKSSVVNLVRAVENIVLERVDKSENKLFDLVQLEWEKEELLEFSKNLFGINKLTYSVFDFLENPLGKFFKPKDFNRSLNEEKIRLHFPIVLDFFKNEFEVRFSYCLRDSRLLGIDSIEIVNMDSGELFMSISLIEDFATSNPLKKAVRKYYSANICLDLNFVLNEIKKESAKILKRNPFKTDFDPDDFEQNSNNSALILGLFSDFSDKKQKDALEAENECLKLQRNLITNFDVVDKCILHTDEGYNLPKEMNYNFVRMIDFLKGEGLLFDYAYQDEAADSYNENSRLTAKREFEREFIQKIQLGKFNTAPWDFQALSLFLDNLDVSSYVLEKNQISKLQLSSLGLDVVGLSQFGDFIINKMVFQNFRNSLGGLKNYFGDHKYIGVDRLSENKNTININDSHEFLEEILSMRIAGVDESPSVAFLNYHFKQFGIDMMGDFRSLAEYYDLVLNDSEIERGIGYGHEKLISIISRLSLPSQFVNPDELSTIFNDSFDGMSAESVRGMFLGKGRLFIIEEPESNLHPNNQTKIADLLIDAAWKFGHQFLIETHSEYLVRKLQFFIASGKIKSEDVQIYYFDKSKDGGLKIESINILSDGSLSRPFGSGFFDESDRISLDLFVARRNNMN
jgi:energy-coupling factor transporter ATP-binding protein EcfA2